MEQNDYRIKKGTLHFIIIVCSVITQGNYRRSASNVPCTIMSRNNPKDVLKSAKELTILRAPHKQFSVILSSKYIYFTYLKIFA
jgi:hypothetical protein